MKRLMIFFLLMAMVALSAAGQVSPKTAELGWLELPAFSEDSEHFFVSHYTDEYWGKQRNYSLFWDQERQIPIWVAYPLNERLIGHGKRSGAWQYDKFMATKKQPDHRRTFIGLRGFDYQTLLPQTLSVLPPAAVRDAWKKDYQSMQESMIYEEPPSFDQIIGKLTSLNRRINALNY